MISAPLPLLQWSRATGGNAPAIMAYSTCWAWYVSLETEKPVCSFGAVCKCPWIETSENGQGTSSICETGVPGAPFHNELLY